MKRLIIVIPPNCSMSATICLFQPFSIKIPLNFLLFRAIIIEKQEKENARLIEIVKGYEDAVYIEVSQISTGSVMAYHIGDCVGVIQPEIHAGMVQDSILYLERIISY